MKNRMQRIFCMILSVCILSLASVAIGDFEEVEVGMSREDVQKLLGPEDSMEPYPYGDILLYRYNHQSFDKYDDVPAELYFQDDTLIIKGFLVEGINADDMEYLRNTLKEKYGDETVPLKAFRLYYLMASGKSITEQDTENYMKELETAGAVFSGWNTEDSIIMLFYKSDQILLISFLPEEQWPTPPQPAEP